MKSHLSDEVLKVNKNWQPIGVVSVEKAFQDAAAGAVTLMKLEDGYPVAYPFEDWIDIPVLIGEPYVSLPHGRKILVPRVSICVNYAKIRAKEMPLNPDNLLRRYGHKDALTGKRLERENFSREHVQPRSKGGSTDWSNIVPMDKKLNSKRGNKAYEAVGLKSPTVLPAPRPLLPINLIRNTQGYPEWKLFHIPD